MNFHAPNFSVTMTETTYNGESSEYNEVWHSGRGSYYYNGYLYSSSVPNSHIPGGSAPTSPSVYGSITIAGIPLNYNGNPNFTNYAYINPEAILDAKYPKPPEPVTPNPVEPPVISGVGEPLVNESALWAGTKAFFGSLATSAYDLGNHLTFGKVLDSERYNDQVNAQGERLYNVAKNLGYSDESVVNGYGLAQALAGEVVGTNNLAEAVAGYDLGTNTMLDGWERAEKAASGVAQVAGTFASGLSVTKSLLRNCFLAGMLVSKYSENNIEQKELVPIEQIKFGNKVWSFNRIINQWEPKLVLETFRTEYNGDIVAINFGNNVIGQVQAKLAR